MIRLLSTKEKCVLTWTFFNHEKLYQPVAHPPADRILPQRFWSSDKLTGSQTYSSLHFHPATFWSSDKLTGSQTVERVNLQKVLFWSSDKLTGSQT